MHYMYKIANRTDNSSDWLEFKSNTNYYNRLLIYTKINIMKMK